MSLLRSRKRFISEAALNSSDEKFITDAVNKYFLITVGDGEINVDCFICGYNGRLRGLTKPITAPLVLS